MYLFIQSSCMDIQIKNNVTQIFKYLIYEKIINWLLNFNFDSHL